MRTRWGTWCTAVMFFAAWAACLTPDRLHAQDARCGAGKDLVVQALERAGPNSSTSDFENALQLLKRASALCSELGDAWYYRSLVEARLGHQPLAKFSADKARLVGSEAMTEGLQPFVLATPAARQASAAGSSSGIPAGSPGRRGMPAGDSPAASGAPAGNSTASAHGAVNGAGNGAGNGAVQQKWALVIGISRFADGSIPQLNYTAGDAQAFASLLSDPGVGRFPKSHVHTLTNAEATTRGIKEQLNWLARQAAPGDMVVIYMATHGSPRETDSVGGLNYLITYDTEIKSLDHPDEDALYATAFPMVELSNAVASRMRALRTLVVLDTCYSGGSIRDPGHNAGRLMGAGLANAAPSPATLQRMSEGSGRIVLAASRVDQESLESDSLQHGYFTYFLLKSLRDSKGMTPLSQVYAEVQQAVSSRVAIDGRAEHLQQNPVMDRSADDADFALGLPPAAVAVWSGSPAGGAHAALPGLGTLPRSWDRPNEEQGLYSPGATQ